MSNVVKLKRETMTILVEESRKRDMTIGGLADLIIQNYAEEHIKPKEEEEEEEEEEEDEEEEDEDEDED